MWRWGLEKRRWLLFRGLCVPKEALHHAVQCHGKLMAICPNVLCFFFLQFIAHFLRGNGGLRRVTATSWGTASRHLA